jgi:hypothetical protein
MELKRILLIHLTLRIKASRAVHSKFELTVVNHLRMFPEWFEGKLSGYGDWFKDARFQRGVKAFSASLYKCNVRKLT